jgi:hypothetical protein
MPGSLGSLVTEHGEVVKEGPALPTEAALPGAARSAPNLSSVLQGRPAKSSMTTREGHSATMGRTRVPVSWGGAKPPQKKGHLGRI